MGNLQAFGDSLTGGFTPSTDLYVYKVAQDQSRTLVNNAVSSSQASDQSFLCYGITPTDSDIYTVSIGTNDCYQYGTDITKRDQGFALFHRALIAWNALPDKVTARDTGMGYFGTWADSGFNSIGKLTSAPWDPYAAACYVSGSTIYVFGAIHNASSSEGKVDVKVDGNVIGSIQTYGTSVGNTSLGRTVSLGCWRFGGLSSGSHLVQLISANTKTFFLDAIAGSDQTTKPFVYVSDVSRRYPLDTLDPVVEAYNRTIETNIHELRGDGLNIVPFWAGKEIDAVLDIYPDGIHWNSSGQQKAYEKLTEAIG